MLKMLEDHSLLVRALLVDTTGNTSMSWNAYSNLGLLTHDRKLDKDKVLAILSKPNGANHLRHGMEGMGRGAYTYLIQLLLENDPALVA